MLLATSVLEIFPKMHLPITTEIIDCRTKLVLVEKAGQSKMLVIWPLRIS